MKRIASRIIVHCLVIATAATWTLSVPVTQEQVRLSTVEEIAAEFKEVPCKGKDRLPAVRTMFERMGAKEADFVTQKLPGVNNLVVKQAGQSDETIVIGAHYDFIDSGCGAVDNWSGIVAMAHAYRTISNLEKRKNLLFVAFDREEKGLVGSRAMANAIPKADVPKYCGMVNIDSFGLALPFALKQTSSDSLMSLSEKVSAALEIPFYTVTIPRTDADSSSFMARGIPAVTLSGLSAEWASILHSKKDQKALVNGPSVYFGYRLAVSLWGRIEQAPCDAFRETKPTLK